MRTKIKSVVEPRIEFKGKLCEGCFYQDGSGYLTIKAVNYCDDSGYFPDRLKDIGRLAKIYTDAYKELKNIKYKECCQKLKKTSIW